MPFSALQTAGALERISTRTMALSTPPTLTPASAPLDPLTMPRESSPPSLPTSPTKLDPSAISKRLTAHRKITVMKRILNIHVLLAKAISEEDPYNYPGTSTTVQQDRTLVSMGWVSRR
ncbi:hypothetical protein KI387_014528, partial [Taxus chinensis]